MKTQPKPKPIVIDMTTSTATTGETTDHQPIPGEWTREMSKELANKITRDAMLRQGDPVTTIHNAITAALAAERKALSIVSKVLVSAEKQLAAEREKVQELTNDYSAAVRIRIKEIQQLLAQLAAAQAAMKEIVEILETSGARMSLQEGWSAIGKIARSIDTTALDAAIAAAKNQGWNEGREHERKCQDAATKPLVDALKWAERRFNATGGAEDAQTCKDALAKAQSYPLPEGK